MLSLAEMVHFPAGLTATASGSSNVLNQLSLALSHVNQINNPNTVQMPTEEHPVKPVQKRNRKNVSVRYFHKWRKDSPCALIPSRDGDARMTTLDPEVREVALGGQIRVCRPTDVPRVCEHVYRYENDSGGSMYQCANCLTQWKQNTSQGGWRVAMHKELCGTRRCQRNPEADLLQQQVHDGGEQHPDSRPRWHDPSIHQPPQLALPQSFPQPPQLALPQSFPQPPQLALPQSFPQPPQLALPQSFPQPPQLGLPQSIQDSLPAQQQALLPAQQAMLAVAQQMRLANLAQQLAGMQPLIPSSIMPGTETTGAVGLDPTGASKCPLGLSASSVALLRQDPSIHQMVSMWSMQREDLARLGLMPLDLSLAGPTPAAEKPGSQTTQTQSEPSSVSHAGPNAYSGPPIACPTGTRGVPLNIPTLPCGSSASSSFLLGRGKDRPGGGFQRTSASQSSAVKPEVSPGAPDSPTAVFKKPAGGVKRSRSGAQGGLSTSVQSIQSSIAKWKRRSRLLGSVSSAKLTSSTIGSVSTVGSSISVESVLEADKHKDVGSGPKVDKHTDADSVPKADKHKDTEFMPEANHPVPESENTQTPQPEIGIGAQ